ncbi:MAG: tetratricopeptide repeat protein [Acidobacteria bacterium]|nr:tetratricopeptide repeat protein [Acidobacteriota bacterium]
MSAGPILGSRSRLAPGRWLGLGAGAAIVLGLIGLAARSQMAPQPSTSEYVDPQTCRPCHSDIFDSYQEVAMGRSFYLPSAENVIEDYKVDNHYYHELSDRHYRMLQRDGRFYQRRYQLDAQGREHNVFEMEVTHIIGSGNHARSYLNLDAGGVLRELPVSWYTQEQRWAMSPGYDRPDHEDFSRQVTHACMFCHNAYPPLPEPSDRLGLDSRFPRELPSGIDCQRCHGPGSGHLELVSSGTADAADIRQTVVNPVRLGPEREMEVCMQCHLQVATAGPHIQRFGRPIYSYRPGEPLAEYSVRFDLVDPKTGELSERFEVDSSSYRLHRSPCFIQSRGKMTCTTCHDPHHAPRGEEAVRHYRERCMDCHAEVSPLAHPQPGESDCASCHMPQRRTQDAVHVVMTDHFIQRRPPPREDLLAPLKEDHSPKPDEVVLHQPDALPDSEREIYLGLGQIRAPVHSARGVDRLELALPRWQGTSPEPYLQLALAQVESGDLDQAGIHLRKALEAGPELAPARFQLGEVLRRQGRPDEAAEQYRHALRLNPGHAAAHNGLGLILKERDQIEAALEHFRLAVRGDLLSAEAHANSGTIFLQEGQVEEATREFHRALQIEPNNPGVYRSLGVVRAGLGRHPQAVGAFRQAISLKPDDAEAHYNLGLSQRELGRQQEAVQAFQKSIDLRPDYAEAHSSLGVTHGQTGRLPEAVEAFRRAVKIDPGYGEAWSNLGLVLGQLGQWREAAAALAQTVRIDPEDFQTHLKLGLAYGQAEEFQQAVEAFQKAIEVKPDFAEAWSNLGAAFGQLGQHQEAIRAFREVVRLQPDTLQAHLRLGTAYVQTGRLPEAISAFQGATRIKPDLVQLHQFIGEAHAQMGQPRQAIPAFRQVLRFQPDNAEARFHLGLAHLAVGERASALEQHRKLNDLDETRASQLMEQINRQPAR